MAHADDTLGTEAVVRVLDVGIAGLSAPVGIIDSGERVVPRVAIYNPGTEEATFQAVLRIGSVYSDGYTLELAPGDQAEVLFAEWTALERGSVSVRCSLDFDGDLVSANDTARSVVLVAVHDAAAAGIVVPVDSIAPGTVIPALSVRNCGTAREPVTAFFDVRGTAYIDSVPLTNGLPVGIDTVIEFRPWFAPRGRFTARGTVAQVTEQRPENDAVERQFLVGLGGVQPGWHPADSLAGPSAVRDGGAMACDPDNRTIYAMKGSRTLEFYSYGPADSGWTRQATVPAGEKNRGVYRGGAMCYGGGSVYATKGNSTFEFYRFDAVSGAWSALTSVPVGSERRKVVAGASMVHVTKPEGDYVYLLKGGGNAFYRYDVAADTFTALEPAPVGERARYGRGSWMAYDGTRYIYALKARYNELHRYDLLDERWTADTALAEMPLNSNVTGRRNKKVGDGGCGAWDGSALYSLKGNGTQEFWRYAPDTDTWVELESIPQAYPGGTRKKRVRSGSALAYYPETGVFYALKGNRSNQFWAYVPGGVTCQAQRGNGRSGVMTKTGQPGVREILRVTPNPLTAGFAEARFAAATTCRTLSVHDVTGRCVFSQRLARDRRSCGLDLHRLAAGVYLAKLQGDGTVETQKLVVER